MMPIKPTKPTKSAKPVDPGYGVDAKRMKEMLTPKKPTKADLAPTPRTKVSPMPNNSEQKKQEKALADLMKKRAAASKKTGSWPNYYTN